MQRLPNAAPTELFISANEVERNEAESLANLLERQGPQKIDSLTLNGKAITVPGPVYELLLRALHYLAQGKAISLVAVESSLTTQKAADILNISRPFLIILLERGEIPFHKVGSHRRISLDALLDYKHRRDQERRSALKQLTEDAQESGLYQSLA